MMRCVTAVPTCLALLVAFFLAPFQHIHPDHVDGGHEHSAIIHTHLFIPLPSDSGPSTFTRPGGVRLIAPEDEEQAFSVNTFTSVAPVVVSLLFNLPSPTAVFVQAETFGQVEFIEERGHDPPFATSAIPRAPPS
ncbi:MAG: hypothetical protein ACRD4E_04380 [Bryobacteraceae bacterium]